ncbi:MAG: hypothetical protein C4B59_08275 [Candidatus Methanogaster sp.]|uniref:Uncharacterized protein n=1 Tax=Candidatus Methanogaster sp. TaxID=3386292 RepID=A0AC61L2K1_9EURY|nr:MAG: hypothetical protein C4B59_08275 [ANME-2 cluster archaeon]
MTIKNTHDLLRSAYTVDEKAISESWLPPLFLRVLRTKRKYTDGNVVVTSTNHFCWNLAALYGLCRVSYDDGFLTLSVFKGRYWCGWFCPRGSFLERILKVVSMNTPIPLFLKNLAFRSVIFCGMVAFMFHRLIQANGDLNKIGFVLVMMCIVTSIIAIILGIFYNPRIWCAFCPMGTLQGLLGRKNIVCRSLMSVLNVDCAKKCALLI